MYYLHIIRDDKFTDHVISTFEDIAPDQSIYLLVTDKKTITYVKNINKITHVNNRTVNYKKILRSIPNLKAVFVNYFYHEQYDLLLSLDKSIKVFWFIYGGDLYGQIYTLEQLLEPLTYQFYIHHQPILQKIKNRIRPFITDFSPSIYKKNKCIKRIDYCSAIVDTEFDLLKKIKGFRAKQVYFNYGSLETLLGAFSEQTVQGDNILVGNSNTLTSNHVDAFKKLADLTLGDRKIIVPLNYGNDDLYKKYVIEKGQFYFGPRFTPLLDFMPLHSYVEMLSSCNMGVFNHKRQQALGNIIIMKWLGATVYLQKCNPIYGYLQHLQVAVNPFETGELSRLAISVQATNDLRETRERLYSNWSDDTIRKRIADILALCDDK